MPITIFAPAAAAIETPVDTRKPFNEPDDDSSSDESGETSSDDGAAAMSGVRLDSSNDNDVAMAGRDTTWHGSKHHIVTPGEIITSDPQWMRGHGTYHGGESNIIATVAGTVTQVNKLLSVKPLRSRYVPAIGDLIVGRIVEVQRERWKVDIASSLFAHLQISSINLPGGLLRRRDAMDELQMRRFFSEGDLLVAEVQQIHALGHSSLHTRSLKYGKLRNGVFMKVNAGSVMRQKSHIYKLTVRGGDEVEVILGVNGFIWIAKIIALRANADEKDKVTMNKMEEQASEEIYSSTNDEISAMTRREIAIIGACVGALVRGNLRASEEHIRWAYEIAVEEEDLGFEGEDGSALKIGSATWGSKIIERVTERRYA